MVSRVDGLEVEAASWLKSFTKMLGVTPNSIAVRADNSQLIDVTFTNESDAALFRKFLPRAGRLINFVPAQLDLYQGSSDNDKIVP